MVMTIGKDGATYEVIKAAEARSLRWGGGKPEKMDAMVVCLISGLTLMLVGCGKTVRLVQPVPVAKPTEESKPEKVVVEQRSLDADAGNEGYLFSEGIG